MSWFTVSGTKKTICDGNTEPFTPFEYKFKVEPGQNMIDVITELSKKETPEHRATFGYTLAGPVIPPYICVFSPIPFPAPSSPARPTTFQPSRFRFAGRSGSGRGPLRRPQWSAVPISSARGAGRRRAQRKRSVARSAGSAVATPTTPLCSDQCERNSESLRS